MRRTMDIDIPLSLRSGAGRQYWHQVLGLLVKIRTDCDAAAERLGYASANSDGLAAVEYIANKILQAIRGERAQHTVRRFKEPISLRDGSEPAVADDKTEPNKTQPNKTEPKTAKRAQPAGHTERSGRIAELKQMLRDGKTKSVIDPQLAHEIAKQITILTEGLTRPETPESLKQMRASIAPFFAKSFAKSDGGKKKQKPPAKALGKKPQRANSLRATMARGSKRRAR